MPVGVGEDAELLDTLAQHSEEAVRTSERTAARAEGSLLVSRPRPSGDTELTLRRV